jgi:hypothetical protein
MSRFPMIHDSSRLVSRDVEHTVRDTRTLWPVAGLAFSLTAVLVSQFALDGAADSSAIVHWMQHGLLFGGGVGTGLTLNAIRSAGQSRA